MDNSTEAAFAHPYYPVTAALPHYVANKNSVVSLLVFFGSIISFVVVTAVAGARNTYPQLKASDQLTVAWFALCGFLHCFFEGYFILNHKSLASDQSLFGQLWKEYALSDSRYLTSDPFMLCVESFTVIPARMGPPLLGHCHTPSGTSCVTLQIIMSVGHLYGVVLYYSTSLIELYSNGVSHSRPEFLYFWVYYIGFNAPWVVVPATILYQTTVHIKRHLTDRADVVAKLNRIDGIMGDKSWQTYVPKDEEKKTN
ncbi:emopamil binding protein [Colletotrichum scovillei]|uniref:emopamil binding protein n=1 Tax=Colletotrichum scovillei TaxID=1209932 RepID=UPI0015C2CA87|nr:emopamil binding protein [Colletotrichum scovillei]KAF4783243.1 emopamil binding protein [Colletotrichum scovillei]